MLMPSLPPALTPPPPAPLTRQNMDKETRRADGKNGMSSAVEGDERLLRAKDMPGHKLLPKIADPLAVSGNGGGMGYSAA